jgi:hypothetical protein
MKAFLGIGSAIKSGPKCQTIIAKQSLMRPCVTMSLRWQLHEMFHWPKAAAGHLLTGRAVQGLIYRSTQKNLGLACRLCGAMAV